MKNLLALLLLIFATTAVPAEDQRMHLVQPKGTRSGLKLMQLQRQNDLFAKFDGQVWVSGTFVARWPDGATNMAYKSPDYLLVPDAAAITKLPYFVLKEAPYFNSYRVRVIDLLNGEDALRIVVSSEDAKRILERKVNSIRATGRFLIKTYVVGVECDASWAKAVLIKADLPEQVALARHKVPEGC